jgi:two-component system, OmpR family, sensor histidine kinase KdpD
MDGRLISSKRRTPGLALLLLVTIPLVTLILFPLRAGLSTTTVALVYLLPVLINTIYGGLVPGVLTAIAAILTYNFFFLEPYYTFFVHESQDLVALVIFLIVAVLISQLVGKANRNLGESMSREGELAHLYELSLALAGINEIQEIAEVIAGRASEILGARAVQVKVSLAHVQEEHLIQFPSQAPLTGEKPSLAAPLVTARGKLGEILIWRDREGSEPSEERILRTFASQSALAIERAALVESETRAKVLEESDRLKTALLSSVSHELRSPLSTIKAAITSLLNDQVGWEEAARKDLLAAVDEETDLLNRLVGNLLDMSRIETGALRPDRQWNLLSEIVEGVTGRMHRVLKDHNLQVHIPEEVPLVPVDYVQMEQVFTNLLSNSIKYAPKGSTIGLSARAQGEEVFVQVTNEGPPIPPANLERIFDKFTRQSEAEKVSGTGLGLSICKGIVEAHGGRIWAENQERGIAFHFTLPATLDGAQPPVIEMEEA